MPLPSAFSCTSLRAAQSQAGGSAPNAFFQCYTETTPVKSETPKWGFVVYWCHHQCNGRAFAGAVTLHFPCWLVSGQK